MSSLALRKESVPQLLSSLPLSLFLFLHHGVPVYGFHHMVRFPSAHLEYIRIRNAESGHLTGKIVSEFMKGKAWYAKLILNFLKMFCDRIRMSFVNISLCSYFSASSMGMIISRVLSVVFVALITHSFCVSCTILLEIRTISPSISSGRRAQISERRIP